MRASAVRRTAASCCRAAASASRALSTSSYVRRSSPVAGSCRRSISTSRSSRRSSPSTSLCIATLQVRQHGHRRQGPVLAAPQPEPLKRRRQVLTPGVVSERHAQLFLRLPLKFARKEINCAYCSAGSSEGPVPRRIPEENLLPIQCKLTLKGRRPLAAKRSNSRRPGAPFNTAFGRSSTPGVSSWRARGAGRGTASRESSRCRLMLPSRRSNERSYQGPSPSSPMPASRSGTMSASSARHVPRSATTENFSTHTARTRPSISRMRNELIFERLAARRPMHNLRAPMP